jgi:hypothetical protein
MGFAAEGAMTLRSADAKRPRPRRTPASSRVHSLSRAGAVAYGPSFTSFEIEPEHGIRVDARKDELMDEMAEGEVVG